MPSALWRLWITAASPAHSPILPHQPSPRPVRTGAAGNTGPVAACARARPGAGVAGSSAACPAAGLCEAPGPGCRRCCLLRRFRRRYLRRRHLRRRSRHCDWQTTHCFGFAEVTWRGGSSRRVVNARGLRSGFEGEERRNFVLADNCEKREVQTTSQLRSIISISTKTTSRKSKGVGRHWLGVGCSQKTYFKI